MINDKKQYSIENKGNHHYAKISLDEKNKEVNAGIIYSYSDNAAASFQYVDGKYIGSIIHSGDNHLLKIDISNDGSYNGSYEEKKGNIKINITNGEAILESGHIPETGIEVNGIHHKIRFYIDNKGKINGIIKSQQTKYGIYEVAIEQGKIHGSFIHKGDNHETGLEVSSDGSCRATIAIGKGNTKFEFSAEKGKIETKTFAKLKLNF